MHRIYGFFAPYRFLFNFYPSLIHLPLDNISYQNAEAAYQAQKETDLAKRKIFFSTAQPGYAKRLGRQVKLPPNWEERKLSIMREVLLAKFSQNPALLKELLQTGSAELVEANSWGDRTWGVDQASGQGQNLLGKLLMQIRTQFQRESFQQHGRLS